jgi:hypothetical protein
VRGSARDSGDRSRALQCGHFAEHDGPARVGSCVSREASALPAERKQKPEHAAGACLQLVPCTTVRGLVGLLIRPLWRAVRESRSWPPHRNRAIRRATRAALSYESEPVVDPREHVPPLLGERASDRSGRDHPPPRRAGDRGVGDRGYCCAPRTGRHLIAAAQTRWPAWRPHRAMSGSLTGPFAGSPQEASSSSFPGAWTLLLLP